MSILTPKKYVGVTELGAPEKVAKLYEFRELVGAAGPVALSPTDPSRWKIWPKRNQGNQSSCTYHARAKMGGILRDQKTGEFVEYSAADYNKRTTPGEGSSPLEALDFMRKYGIGLEALEPSNNISPQALAEVRQSEFEKKVASLSLLDAFYALPMFDFDTLVSTLHATQKPIMIGIYGSYNEYSRDIPAVLENLTPDTAAVRHEICATPNYGIYKGQEGFTIEDSWGSAGINGTGVRWITRDFFTKRNLIQGLVPASFKGYEDMNVNPAKPKVKLERDLDFGMTGEDVRALQSVYKFEGLFPANHNGSDYFGTITQECTRQYQKKYGIVSAGTPATTGYGRVGPSTREHINNKYQ